jgi:hypothetical protein
MIQLLFFFVIFSFYGLMIFPFLLSLSSLLHVVLDTWAFACRFSLLYCIVFSSFPRYVHELCTLV